MGDTGMDKRDQLLDAAVRLLAQEGPAVLQARRLTREVGASTMAVYHYFGGMPGLLAALIEEGFRKLDAHLAEVPITADPIADILQLGLAYRTAARKNPHLYDLMFGLSAPESHKKHESPADGEANLAQRTYERLVDVVERAIQAGRLKDGEPVHVAAQLWSVLHGYVTLELSGRFADEDGVTQIFIPMAINLLVGLGDSPASAASSLADYAESHGSSA